MTEFTKNIRDMVWSFSRLNSYDTCPYGWYLQYIIKQPGESNFFAESGIAMHKVLEELEKGIITIDDAPERFNRLWNPNFKVKESIIENSYAAQMNYLTSLTGHELDDYEILGAEKRYKFEICGYKFVGMIDLLLRNKDGDIIVVDHKSHKKLLGKNGKPLKSEEKTFLDYQRQQYLYSFPVFKEYGKYPVKLVWNHFKSGDLTVVDFNEERYEEAIQWAIGTIKKIEEDADFIEKKDYFFCHNICGYRNECEYMGEE